ncbi:hypothetical protein O988_04190 [Pseudogymnoascus sp. VKM F-3808]|nr:hypothetical protein O988_04190 [Pseudogymnoascus sp. VKM F-3808]
MKAIFFQAALVLNFLSLVTAAPFFTKVDSETWIFGNELWNVTQKGKNAKPLYYKKKELVGNAQGHYYSSSNTTSDFTISSASVVSEGEYKDTPYIDISLDCPAGEEHSVIFTGLAGAYQYFVNKGLSDQGEYRSLWRLDNTTFTHGKTGRKDEELPPLSWHTEETKVFDSTYLRPDGTYVTKYDFTSFLRGMEFYGTYGDGFGSWYINPGKDYYNGDHLRQELTVHREAVTGDTVQLNMLHGTHFFRSINDTIPVGKMWGPWLWYLNDGSQSDVEERAAAEFAAWPYSWLDNSDYQSRGSVSGSLVLSDGRPASYAAIFLGDSNSDTDTIRQGSTYYYTSYADESGNFEIDNVREGTYGLRAWSNGSSIADVSTVFTQNKVVIASDKNSDLGTLKWALPDRERIWRVGDFDRTAYGFKVGGAPYAYGLTELCSKNIDYVIGESQSSDWCYAQTKVGNWTISFPVSTEVSSTRKPTLVISLAGWVSNASSTVFVNDHEIGELSGFTNDGALYRSSTINGDWRYLEFPFDAEFLKLGDENTNKLTFQLYSNLGDGSALTTTQRGAMFDAIALDW